jgi:hypothetical protein
MASCRGVFRSLVLLAALLTASAQAAEPVRFTVEMPTPKSRGPDVMSYLLGALTSSGTDCRKGDGWEVPALELPPDTFTFLASLLQPDGTLDWGPFYKQIGGAYLRARALRHGAEALPETLAEFEARTQFRSWDGYLVDGSSVKEGLDRQIWSSASLSVAQTLEPAEGSAPRRVRETEVIQGRPGTRHADFYVYDAQGTLSVTSHFRDPKRGAPVPMTCMNCHFNEQTRAYSFAPASYGGNRVRAVERPAPAPLPNL